MFCTFTVPRRMLPRALLLVAAYQWSPTPVLAPPLTSRSAVYRRVLRSIVSAPLPPCPSSRSLTRLTPPGRSTRRRAPSSSWAASPPRPRRRRRATRRAGGPAGASLRGAAARAAGPYGTRGPRPAPPVQGARRPRSRLPVKTKRQVQCLRLRADVARDSSHRLGLAAAGPGHASEGKLYQNLG